MYMAMAMLAEPRRKQKVINLRAKNNAWSNDNTKFGQRMLEKMGWTSGKGLGANENGITEHVIARYKNDERGLGFKDKNDQWTKHDDDFNALLANLSNASNNTENLHSGVSLEDKSKKSKARIHYHKFTRGKDISRYSEKDLANIFGKKSFKSTEVVDEDLKEDLKQTEQKIFTEKGSMDDYFKNKLAACKSKSKFNISNVIENCVDHDDPSYDFHGFSQDNDDLENCNGLNQEERNSDDRSSMNHVKCDSVKLKKRKNTNIGSCSNSPLHIEHCLDQIQRCLEEETKKKKKSKIQNNYVENEQDEESLSQFNSQGNYIQKTKKQSKKDKVRDTSDNIQIDKYGGDEQNQEESRLKKKKSKYVVNCEETIVPDIVKKKKKSKRKNEVEYVTPNIDEIENNRTNKKKKKIKCKENE